MSLLTFEDFTADTYRVRKRTLVSIFSQPSPYNAKNDPKLAKMTVKDKNGFNPDVDAVSLQDVFKSIDYPESAEVELYNAFNKQKIMKWIKELGESKQTAEFDTFFFVFLTYLSCEKTDNKVYRDERIHLEDGLCSLQEIFDEVKKVEALRMKPKIFLIQADDSSLKQPMQIEKGDEIIRTMKIPQDADRLVIMSNIPQSFANLSGGKAMASFLIKAFCDTLMENSRRTPEKRLDLYSLTPYINKRVEQMIEELKGSGLEIAKDMSVPLVTSTLTKLVLI